MSTTVENQIVELEFDNRDFEKNVSVSLQTLETLKKQLEFENASKGFEQIQNGLKNLDFSSFTDKLNDIDNHFTSVLDRIELKIRDFIAGEAVAKLKEILSGTIGQIQSGGRTRAMNIEQAQFKIRGLGKDWTKVYEDMDYAVSGTAYGIDQAASAASQFLASNVKVGAEMKAALRGISGIAAMTSQSYDHVAYIFTAAAGKGIAQAMELMRISRLGINAYAALAKYYGVTENQIREMSRKGQISFKDFAKAMDDAFGEHAKKANETFTGSLANVRAALSRIGEVYYEPWIRSMIPFFNALRETIDTVKNALKQVVDGIENNTVANNLRNLLLAIGDLKAAIAKSFIPTFQKLGDRFDWVIDKIQEATIRVKALAYAFKRYNSLHIKKKESTADTVEKEVANSVSAEAKFLGVTTTIKNTAITLDAEIGTAVTSILDRYKSLYNAQKNALVSTTNLFSKWAHQYKTSFNTLNKNLKSNKKGLETLAKDMSTLENKGILSEEFIERLKSMGTSGADIVHALAKATDKDLKEYMKTWNQTEGMFDSITNDWTKGAREEAEKELEKVTGIPEAKMEDYMKTFDDMFEQLGMSAGNGYHNGFASVLEQFNTAFDEQMAQIEAYNQAMEDARKAREDEEEKEKAENQKYTEISKLYAVQYAKFMKEAWKNGYIEKIGVAITHFHRTIANLFAILDSLGRSIFEILNAIGEAAFETWDQFNTVGTKVKLGPLAKLIMYLKQIVLNFEVTGERAELIKSTFKGVFSVIQLISWAIGKLIDIVGPILVSLSEGEPIILRLTGAIGEFITALVDGIINGGDMSKVFDILTKGIKGFFEGFIKLLTGDGKKSAGLLSSIFDGIGKVFTNIIEFIKNLFGNVKDTAAKGGFGEFVKTLFSEIFSIERLQIIFGDAFYYLQQMFGTLFNLSDGVLNIIPDVLQTVWGFIKDNGEAISTLLVSIINLATKFVNAISGLIDKLTTESSDKDPGKGAEALTSFFELLIAIFTSLKEVVLAMKDPIITIIKTLSDLFTKFAEWAGDDVERSYGAAAFFTIMAFLMKVQDNKKLKNGGIIKNLQMLTSSITQFFNALKGNANAKNANQTINNIVKIARALLLFAVAIFLLSNAFTTSDDKFNIGGLFAVLVIFGAIILITKLMKEWTKVLPTSAMEVLQIDGFIKVMRKLVVSFAIMAIMFAILASVLGKMDSPLEVAIAAMIPMAVAFIFMAAIMDTVVRGVDKTTATGMLAVKQMSAISRLFLAFGVSVALIIAAIVPLIVVMGALKFLLKDDFDDVVGATFLILLVIMAAMVIVMGAAANMESKMSIKEFGGLALLMLAFSISMSMMIGSLTALIAVMAILNVTNSYSLLGFAFGALVAIFVMMLAFMQETAKIKGESFLQMAAAMVGMSIMIVTISQLLMVLTGMLLIFKLAHVTPEDIDTILKLLAPIGIALLALVAVFAIMTMAFSGSGTAGLAGAGAAAIAILAIAAAIYIIAKAFSTLVISIALFLAVGGLLAYFWDDIKPGFEKMLNDLGGTGDGTNGMLYKIVTLIGKGIRWLCKEIELSAPYIANAITTVASTAIFLSMQKIPMHALALLMAIDEVLTIILKGGGMIINKFLLLLEMVLIALDANADVLGYQIGHTIMKAFLYALEGAFDALSDVVLKFVEKFYDDLIGTFWDSFSEDPIFDKFGDMIYKRMTGSSIDEDIAELNKVGVGDWYKDASGKWVRATKEGEADLVNAADNYDKSAKEAKEKVDNANKDLAAPNKYEWKTPEYDEKFKDVSSIKDDEEFKELQKEYHVNDDQLESIKNGGEISGEAFSSGVSDYLNSEKGNSVLNYFNDIINNTGTKNAANDAGKSLGERLFEGVKGVIGNYTGTSDLLGGVFTNSLSGIMPKLDTSGTGSSGIWDYNKYYSMLGTNSYSAENGDIIGVLGGTDYDTNQFLQYDENGNAVYGGPMAQQYDTSQIEVTNQNVQKTNETMGKVDETLNNLNSKLDDVALVNKNTKLTTVIEMDSAKVAEKTFPFSSYLQEDQQVRKDANVAGVVRVR